MISNVVPTTVGARPSGPWTGPRILGRMIRRPLAALALTALALAPGWPLEALDSAPLEPGARVQHHLREIAPIVEHFESVLASDCPRFASRAAWRAWLDDEVERVVLLLAHLEQAWVEAKQAPDDDTRRLAKAPRKNVDRVRALLEKLQDCAGENGVSFSPPSVWRRVEREAPRRQVEIALPR